MKEIFDEVSLKCSEITTKRYSTSFSLGIKLLDKSIHNPIYSIYGFVRLADEIVDNMHAYSKIKVFFGYNRFYLPFHMLSLWSRRTSSSGMQQNCLQF